MELYEIRVRSGLGLQPSCVLASLDSRRMNRLEMGGGEGLLAREDGECHMELSCCGREGC